MKDPELSLTKCASHFFFRNYSPVSVCEQCGYFNSFEGILCSWLLCETKGLRFCQVVATFNTQKYLNVLEMYLGPHSRKQRFRFANENTHPSDIDITRAIAIQASTYVLSYVFFFKYIGDGLIWVYLPVGNICTYRWWSDSPAVFIANNPLEIPPFPLGFFLLRCQRNSCPWLLKLYLQALISSPLSPIPSSDEATDNDMKRKGSMVRGKE